MKEIQLEVQNAWKGRGVLNRVILGWKYDSQDEAKIQKKYCIHIKRLNQIVYSSGWVESDRQNQISCVFDMEPAAKYEAVVETEDFLGIRQTSEEISFITGIREEDWTSKWISAGTKKPFLASKVFRIDSPVKEAVISISGMGQFEAKLNGVKIGNTVLDGAWTDYDRTVPYTVFDVSGLLLEGENILTVEVGNGWYIGDTSENRHFYTIGEHAYHAYGPYLCCRVQMYVYPSAVKEVCRIMTDKSWKVWPSDVTLSNVYGSEDQDARRRVNEFRLKSGNAPNAIELSGRECPKGEMRAAAEPPVVIRKSYSPVLVKKVGDAFVYDLGQNMSGIFEIRAAGPGGSRIKITPVEKLDKEGKPAKTVNTYSWYTLSGEEEDIFYPKFCYAAGRWLVIEGAEPKNMSSRGEKPEILEVTGHFITSAAESCGEFKTSDLRYGEILKLVETAIDSNLNHVHTDCPSVEKLGWQEINHLMGPSIMFIRQVDTLWSKISADMRDAQYRPEETDVDLNNKSMVYGGGMIPSIAPRYAQFLHAGSAGSFWDIIPWGSSILLAAECQRSFYDNQQIIEENYDTAFRYVEYLWGKYQAYHTIYQKIGDAKFLCHGLGDWGIEQGEGNSRENIETAFLYKDLKVLSEWAKILGKPEEILYRSRAAEVLFNYNQALLKQGPDGEWFYDAYDSPDTKITQVNQAIPLDFDMVPSEKRESVKRSFVKIISSGKIDSGEIGFRYVLHQAAVCNQQDKVHEMMMQKEHPSYYRFIEFGETTLPEFWRDDARSRNHDMMGHIIEWFYRNVAGIWSEDGYHTISIKPELPSQIEWVDCTYECVTGKVRVFCSISGEEAVLCVELPPNTVGKIFCPGQDKYRWERNSMTIEGGGKIQVKGKRFDECRN